MRTSRNGRSLHTNTIFIVLLFISFLGCASKNSLVPERVIGNETIIKGQVLNKQEKEPIADAKVYIENTSLYTYSDENGNFSLSNVPRNLIKLRLDKRGFISVDEKVNLVDSTAYDLQIKMQKGGREQDQIAINKEQRNVEKYENLRKQFIEIKEEIAAVESELLATNTVASSNKSETKSRLDVFTNYFITGDPTKCFALNTDRIRFDERRLTKGVIEITKPVEFFVLNLETGYKVKVMLHTFIAKRDEAGLIMDADADYIFEELVPMNKDEEREWEEARREFFRGSFRHFLMATASAYEPSYYGYKVYQGTALKQATSIGSSYSEVVDTEVLKENYLQENVTGLRRTFDFEGTLKVEYVRRTWGAKDNLYAAYGYQYETSWIRSRSPEITFSINGILEDEESVDITGAWALKRVCERVPANYLPSY